MKLIDGTPKAMRLIKELKASGDLIDIYSEEYFRKRNDDEFNSKRLAELIKESGDEFLHHLLIGCFHGDSEKLIELINLCPIQKDRMNLFEYENSPTFVFINLKTKSIMLLGMWRRKAQIIERLIYKASNDQSDDIEGMDCLEVIKDIRQSFEKVIEGIYPTIHGYSIGELDELIVGRNGKYFLNEEQANEVEADDEDEGFSKEEIEDRRTDLYLAEENRDEGEAQLNSYFPSFTVENLWG